MKSKIPPAFPKAEEISRIKEPLTWTAAKRALMGEACREMAVFHRDNSAEIRGLYERRKFRPESIRSESDLEKIPPVGVTAMKYFLMTCLPQKEVFLKLTSSGTRGQKTQVLFDSASLDRVQAMLERVWEQEGLISGKPANYMMFVYDPKEAKDLGIAFSDKNQQRFAPAAAVHYAIRKNKAGEWEFDKAGAIAKMFEYEADSKPVRIFGMPGFIHGFLEELELRKLRIKLPAQSLVMTGGGWKAAEDKKVSRDFFRMKMTGLLGIPGDRVRDGYGFAEHSAPYLQCRNHRFHVPVYNRVYARDPVTMRILKPGQTGLLEFVTPYNAMMPNLALLSTDTGCINQGRCGCGWNAPVFTLAGRSGLTKHKGCALTADELVRKG
ncbi:MAG: acyl-protein synthetase [Elusimicrobia bacterium]|nr:acyl-protein synthetase [Elusimicrobiota bacterium]